MKTKFKVGDIIIATIGGRKEVVDIRLGKKEDSKQFKLGNGQKLNLIYTGELCYILKYLDLKNKYTIETVDAADHNYHSMSSNPKIFNFYTEQWEKFLTNKNSNE